MKKTLLIAMLLILVSFSFAEIFTIGNGTYTQPYAPMYGYYNYSWSKILYTVAEMNDAGLFSPATIMSIGFDVGNSPSNYALSNQQIYIRNTTSTTFDPDYPSLADYTMAFNGNVLFHGSGWHVTNLNTPFLWDGQSNLEFLWRNSNGSWASGYPDFNSTYTPQFRMAYQYSDNSLPTGTGTQDSYRPNIQIHAEQNIPDGPAVFLYPTSLDFGSVPFGAQSHSLTVRATNYGQGILNLSTDDVFFTGTHADMYDYDSSVFPISLDSGEHIEIPITVTGTTQGTVTANLVASYGGVEESITLTAYILPEGLVEIGDGTLTQRYPFGQYYGYERSMSIYTFDEIMRPGILNSIAWDCATPRTVATIYKIYLGTTNQTQVQSQPFAQAVAGLTLVKEGSYTFSTAGWHTFELDSPFVYTSGNLVIAIETNYGGSGSGSSTDPNFRYTLSGTNSHAYWLSDSSPPTGVPSSLNTNRPNVQLVLGDLTGPAELAVSPQSLSFGTVFNGAQVGPRNVVISNIGGEDVVINATDISFSGSHAAEFSFNDSAFPVTLPSAQTFQLPVYVTGTTTGNISATLEINSNNQSLEVALSAQVLPPGTMIIGDGTLTQRFPFGHLYGYERSVAIYTMDEVGTAGIIHSVGWDCSSIGSISIPYKIYIGSTTATQVEATSFPSIVQNLTLAKEGYYTFSNMGWNMFELDEPFLYTNDNLIIAVECNYGGSGTGSYPYFYYTTTDASYTHASWQQDSSQPTASGNRNSLRPNLRMTIGALDGPAELVVSPVSIDFGTVFNAAQAGPQHVTIVNIGGESTVVNAGAFSIIGANAADFSFDASAFPVTLDSAQSIQLPLYMTGNTTGSISATLLIESNNQSLEVELSGHVLPPGIVIIGEGTTTQRFPWGHVYGYERSAAIYTATEIGSAGLIEGIGWDCSNIGGGANIPYKIYMGTTDATTLTTQTFAALTSNLTMVKEGVQVFSDTGWNMFNLDTPYVYIDGNLIIAIEVNYGGSGGGTSPSIYYTNSLTGSHCYWVADSSPPTTNSSLNALRPNIMMAMSDFTGPAELAISPLSIDFGTVFNGALVGPRHVTITNIGGDDAVINASDISITGTHATEFSFDANAFPITITSTQSAQLPVYATGTTVGDISATLLIENNTQMLEVALSAHVMPPGTMIVGDGTASQRFPFGHLYGYERTVSIYTMDEIGTVGIIQSLGWDCATAGSVSIPYKIYIGNTDYEQVPSQSFQTITSGLTLVREGNHIFSSTGWNNFDLTTPFVYTGGNLMIAVENNYGGTGTSGYPYFYYTTTTGTYYNATWQQDNSQPTASGSLTLSRPNLRMTFGDLTGDPELASFPNALSFGEVSNGTPSLPQNVTVANIGGGTITLTEDNFSFGGTHTDAFHYPDNIFPIVLESATVSHIPIHVNTTMPGNISATLTITWEDQSVSTTLSAYVLPPGLVIIGDGTTDLKLPVNAYYGYSYTQQLYLQSEINMQDKQIEQIAFYWNGAGTGNNTRDWTIWMGHTALNSLSSYLPINQMTQVFHGDVLATNTPGWITIDLDFPFLYNNTDNLVIAIDENTPGYDGSSQYYYCTGTTASRALRYYSDSVNPDPATPPTPTVMQGFPNIRMLLFDIPDSPMLTYNPYELDFGVVSYDEQEGPLQVNVGNRGIGTLILNADDISFGGDHGDMFNFDDSVFPLSMLSGEFASFPVYVQSTQAGDISAYLIITYDEIEHFVQLTAHVLPRGLHILEIGDGTQVNGDTGSPAPYGTWYRCFREQYLFRASEIYALGGAPGLINSIAWNVQSVGQCSPMPNYRIRVKHTAQESLDSTFETGEYTQVYHHDSYAPIDGWNLHMFSEPFLWNGEDNLLVEVVTDQTVSSYTRNALTYYTATPFSSSLRYQSDSGTGMSGTTGSINTNRPNTLLYMVLDGMGNLNGTVREDGFPVRNVNVSIQGTVFTTQTNNNGYYSFPYAPVGEQTIVASKTGYTTVSQTIDIAEDETTVLDFDMVGTPQFALSENSWHFGEVTLGGSLHKDFTASNAGGSALTITSIEIMGSGAFYLTQMPNLPATLRSDHSVSFRVNFTPATVGMLQATVVITDDQNNRYVLGSREGLSSASIGREMHSRATHQIALTGAGVSELTIGTGNEQLRLPLDYWWKTSVFQTILTADDLNGFMGFITGIKLYSNFSTGVPSTPFKIWLAGTNQTDLSGGWISSNDMTLVFDGSATFPTGESTISIELDDPFLFIEHSNLVMLFYRPMDTQYYSSSNYFKCQTIGSNRSLNIYSDSETYNPASMTSGTLSGQFPMMTLDVIPGGVGHIEGIVRGEDGTPLSGVQVNVGVRMSATTNHNGEFYIPNLLPNNYRVTFTRYGYLTVTEDITIEESDTIEMDITMQEMPQVSIVGTVVASDTGEGIEGVSVSFNGYANYNVATNTAGEFIVDSNVYAYNTYEYVISTNGYTSQYGTIEVGPQDYDMGTITMEELAYAPTQAAAAVSPDYSSVNISWNPPDPDALEIIESFESVIFPPTDWTQTITNNGPPNMFGVRPTWCRFGSADGVMPTNGSQQAGFAWVAEHQDEWLITPTFTCPPDAYLRFDTHLEMGSDGGDHYYVKSSNDGGTTWQVLWDGAAQPAVFNNYDTPIIVDLTQFGGQAIKLAWHANDGSDNLGMYHNWYIDNVYIGNFIRTDQLSVFADSPALTTSSQDANATRGISIEETNIQLSHTLPKSINRALTGYKVWRLRSGQEDAENNWVLLTDEMLDETGLVDGSWQTLAEGEYIWAIKAVYTADVHSMPVFTNPLFKENVNGTISGFVRQSGNNQAIAGVVVSAGDASSTTTASGFYSISLPAGSYSVTASHENYRTLTHDDVIAVPNENTTLNFIMVPTSTEDVVEIAVTALSANYPNPFNPETTISYDIKDSAEVRLDVFNLKGQLIKTLVNDQQPSGRYNVVFTAYDEKGNKLSSGLYFYRLRAGDYVKTRKMMLME